MEEYATKVVQVTRDIRPGARSAEAKASRHAGVAEIIDGEHGRQTACDGSIDPGPPTFFPVSLCN